MKLKTIGTGSSGNAYLLDSGKEVLMIECGVTIQTIKKGLNYDLTRVVGCLVSHSHNDHSIAIGDVLNCGIKVFASKHTFESKNIAASPQKAIVVNPLEPVQIGSFKVMPFELKHDVPCLGFLIKHPQSGTTAFITDTIYCEYIFEGLNNIIIEANYSKEIIDQKMKEGGNKFMRDRVLHSHLSLENCVKMLKANDLTKVNNIVLIHLSNNHSDEELFKNEIEKAAPGKNVTIAFNGLEIPFNKTPF